jgi:hypothetical protein
VATKLYLHRATANPPGTMPSATALGGTPTVTASGAATLRWLDGTISAAAQTSAQTTTDGTANAQTAWHTRHVSAPLAAQTISAQTITYSLAADEANAGSNFNPSIYIALWRPGTGTKVGDILAVGTITATEPGTTQTATSGTGTSTQQIAQAGDVIIIETWRKSVAPGAATARTNTTYYDGTTEASTTNVASFVNFANTLTLQAIAPAPTTLAITWAGSTPTISLPVAAAPTTLAMTFVGATPTVMASDNKAAAPTVLAMTWAGATPIVATPVAIAPTTLAMTFSGATPTVVATDNKDSQPTALALTFSGATPAVDVTDNQFAEPTALSMTLTGATPSVLTPVATEPSALAMTFSGATPTVATPIASEPADLSLALSFATPTVATPTATAPDPFAMTWAGNTPLVEMPVHQTPDALAMAWTGATPSVSTGASIAVTPSALSLTLSLTTPGVTVTDNLSSRPTAAALVLAFATPTVVSTANRLVTPSPMVLRWIGAVPIIGGVVEDAKLIWPIWPQLTVRIPNDVFSRPGPLRMGMIFAVPEVRVIDDGDMMRMLDLIPVVG